MRTSCEIIMTDDERTGGVHTGIALSNLLEPGTRVRFRTRVLPTFVLRTSSCIFRDYYKVTAAAAPNLCVPLTKLS